MSKRQEILEYIKSHNAEKGYSPSVREISEKVHLFSESTAHGHLKRLERDGVIKRLGIRRIEVVGISNQVDVISHIDGLPNVIYWQDRRFIYDPLG